MLVKSFAEFAYRCFVLSCVSCFIPIPACNSERPTVSRLNSQCNFNHTRALSDRPPCQCRKQHRLQPLTTAASLIALTPRSPSSGFVAVLFVSRKASSRKRKTDSSRLGAVIQVANGLSSSAAEHRPTTAEVAHEAFCPRCEEQNIAECFPASTDAGAASGDHHPGHWTMQ